jgi:hypothetical protein
MRDERHPWKPSECSILELAIRGASTKTVYPAPSNQELDVIRERFQSRRFTDLRAILGKKGWPVGSGESFTPRDIYPGTVRA